MPTCPHCKQEADFEENGGELNCTACGQVVEGQHFSSDVTFTKGADGESAAVGQYVSGGGTGPTRIAAGRIYNQVDSHERSLAIGRDEIHRLVLALHIQQAIDDITEGSHRLYRIALQNNFTRGRRVAQVAGACLYVYCRQDKQPYMLIDISDALQINVFTLGTVFLQLCRVLRLDDHPMFTRPIDPSLFIHRFVSQLLVSDEHKRKHQAVVNTSLRLVKSMKRDWMQTGRRPSGVCAGALFIAVHLHGLEFTRRQIVAVVHIGEATLAKRVSEFATTAAGALTLTEFDTRCRELEEEQQALLDSPPAQAEKELDPDYCCIHVGTDSFTGRDLGGTVYRSGMCLLCYQEYLEVGGGQVQGHNPPAFTRGLIKTAKAAEAEAGVNEEDEQEILALPAPGDCQEGDSLEAEMHAAIASTEMSNFAKAALPQGELRRSTRAASQAAARAATAQQQSAQHPTPDSPQTPLTSPSEQATATPFDPQQLAAQPSNGASPPGHQQQSADGKQSQGADPNQDQGADPKLAMVAVPEADDAVGYELPQPVSPAEGGDAEASPADDVAPVAETLSDVSDMDTEEFIVRDTNELRKKGEMWDTANRDWLEAQELKKAQLEEAHQARTQKMAEEEAKEAEGGRKRGRGRPIGSKTKPKPEDNIGPSETAGEAVAKLMHAKKLTSKVDYDALGDLLAPAESAQPAKKRKVGDAIQERERKQAEAAAQKRARQQQALAADKNKQRSGSGSLMGLGGSMRGSRLGPGLRSGPGKSSNLDMLGKFRQKQEQPMSPGRFKPTSPKAGGR